MKREYDFSKGERGKFYRSDAELSFPVYLDPEIADFLRAFAGKKNVEIEKVVNDWLRIHIESMRTPH